MIITFWGRYGDRERLPTSHVGRHTSYRHTSYRLCLSDASEAGHGCDASSNQAEKVHSKTYTLKRNFD